MKALSIVLTSDYPKCPLAPTFRGLREQSSDPTLVFCPATTMAEIEHAIVDETEQGGDVMNSVLFVELKHLCVQLLDLLQNSNKNPSFLSHLLHLLQRSSPASLQPFFEYASIASIHFEFGLLLFFVCLKFPGVKFVLVFGLIIGSSLRLMIKNGCLFGYFMNCLPFLFVPLSFY